MFKVYTVGEIVDHRVENQWQWRVVVSVTPLKLRVKNEDCSVRSADVRKLVTSMQPSSLSRLYV